MSDIRGFDLDTRVHHGLIHKGKAYLAEKVGMPGRCAKNQMREVLDKIDSLLAEAGTHRNASCTSRCGSTT
jgi:hypothetical protein